MIWHLSIALFTFFAVMLLGSAVQASVYQDTTAADTVYKNVDVEVHYEWGDPEKDTDVSVQVPKNTKHIEKVIIIQESRKCEIFLAKGVRVKIFDHKSGKLILDIIGG